MAVNMTKSEKFNWSFTTNPIQGANNALHRDVPKTTVKLLSNHQSPAVTDSSNFWFRKEKYSLNCI